MPRQPRGTRRHDSEREARLERRSAAREEKKGKGTEAPSSSRARPARSQSECLEREARLQRRSAARESPAARPPEKEKKRRGTEASSSSSPRAALYRSRSEESHTSTGGDSLPLNPCRDASGSVRRESGHQEHAARKTQFPEKERTPSSPSGTAASAYDTVYAIMAEKMRKIAAAYDFNKKFYDQLRQRQKENHNITVETTFCNVDDGSLESLEARKAALLVSKSVVSLSSFSGEKRMRVCSGFVMRWNDHTSTCLVLTSATLVRSPGSDNHVIPDLRVKVLLPGGHACNGLISMLDFHHNIVMVEITSDQKLPEAVLCHDVIDRGEVIALGRFYDDGDLMCSRGQITKQRSTLHCSELLVSSCNITMAGVGGPLANYSGSVIEKYFARGLDFSTLRLKWCHYMFWNVYLTSLEKLRRVYT